MHARRHPWQGAYDKFMQDTVPMLEQHGQRIGDAAVQGDEIAGDIVKYYSMLYQSFDPMTAHILHKKIIKWLRQQMPIAAAVTGRWHSDRENRSNTPKRA